MVNEFGLLILSSSKNVLRLSSHLPTGAQTLAYGLANWSSVMEMMSAEKEVRRGWSTFSLRTLFVILTTLALVVGWLGALWRTVQDRQQMMRTIMEREGCYMAISGGPVLAPRSITMNPDTFDVGLVREFFGDEFVMSITLTEDMFGKHHERVSKLFPEAEIETVANSWLADFFDGKPPVDTDQKPAAR